MAPYFPATRDPSGYQWAEDLEGGPSGLAFAAWAQEHSVTLLGSIFERGSCSDAHWDTAVLYGPDGRLTHFTRKVHIPAGDGYHETDFFGGARAYPVHDIGARPAWQRPPATTSGSRSWRGSTPCAARS